MYDTNIGILNIAGGVILMINSPVCEKFIKVKLINKISKKDGSSFIFPALYGNFHCEEGEIISDEVYESYRTLRKIYNYENIFVFEAFENRESTDKSSKIYSISSLISFAEAVISAQNKIKDSDFSEVFESFLQSSFYSDFISEYSFTASELLILRGLLRYAFLTGIKPEKLIRELKENLEIKQNKKLLRKELINAFRQRLS